MDLTPYCYTLLSLWIMGSLMLVQLLIADVIGIRHRHRPGTPVTPEQGPFFRVTRTLANTNESVAIFLLAAVFGLLAGASPVLMNIGSLIYLAGRIGHMVCYYAAWGLPRSVCFGVSLLGVALMLFAGAAPAMALL